MPAVTPTVPAAIRELSKPYMGYKHEVHTFSGPIAGSDTYTVPGGTNTIADYAWFATSVSASRWAITNATTMTITGASTLGGKLHIWRKGGAPSV